METESCECCGHGDLDGDLEGKVAVLFLKNASRKAAKKLARSFGFEILEWNWHLKTIIIAVPPGKEEEFATKFKKDGYLVKDTCLCTGL